MDEQTELCKCPGCEPVGHDRGDPEHAALGEEGEGPCGQRLQHHGPSVSWWWWLLHVQVWSRGLLRLPEVLEGKGSPRGALGGFLFTHVL